MLRSFSLHHRFTRPSPSWRWNLLDLAPEFCHQPERSYRRRFSARAIDSSITYKRASPALFPNASQRFDIRISALHCSHWFVCSWFSIQSNIVLFLFHFVSFHRSRHLRPAFTFGVAIMFNNGFIIALPFSVCWLQINCHWFHAAIKGQLIFVLHRLMSTMFCGRANLRPSMAICIYGDRLLFLHALNLFG